MLFLATGKRGYMADDNGILWKDFIGGNCLYIFNFAPDLALSGVSQPARLAPIALEATFNTQIPRDMQLIAMCVYDTKFEVTKLRNVIVDPSQTTN